MYSIVAIKEVSKLMKISVIICTYNRCDSLRDTLQAMSLQSVEASLDLEIIVVDNNSKDQTSRVVEESAKTIPWPVRYIFEPNQGLSFARNRGVREAKGDFIIFTDDDILPERDWIQNLWSTREQLGADVIGGKVLPHWNQPVPSWAEDPKLRSTIWGMLALVDRGDETLKAKTDEANFLYGANMAFKKEIFQELGLFRTELGRIGKQLTSGEDSEMIGRALKAGKQIFYTPRAVVLHKVESERLNPKYLYRWKTQGGHSAALMAYQKEGDSFKIPKWLFREMITSFIKMIFARWRGDKLAYLCHQLDCIGQWSRFKSSVGLFFSKPTLEQDASSKALLVAYRFPPQGGIGVHRTVKFAKYLPQMGWKPVVLTVNSSPSYKKDASLIKEISKETPIYRSFTFEPFGSWRKRKSLKPKKFQTQSPQVGIKSPSKPNLIKQLIRGFVTFFSCPDEQVGWIPFAVLKGYAAIKKERPKLIYSSGPPFSCHLVGLFLKKWTGLPLIVDFRDDWTFGRESVGIYQNSFPGRRAFEQWLERKIASASDKIIANTDKMRSRFLKQFPDCDEKKIVTITEGFDPEDIPALEKEIKNGKYKITYTGSFYTWDGRQSPSFFLKVVNDLLKENQELRAKLEIVLVGSTSEEVLSGLNHPDYSFVSAVIKRVGFIPHRESLRYLQRSHLSLLILNGANERLNEEIVPAKTFDYLGVGKPIMALTSQGLCADLVQESGIGTVVAPDDSNGITQVILKHYEIYKRSHEESLLPNAELLDRFNRKNLTEQLSSVFDEVKSK